MSGSDDLWALVFGADSVPSEVARIPVKAIEAVGAHLMPIAEERTTVMDSQYRHGYVEGRHELVREIAEIIKREMAPAVELYRQIVEEADRD